MKVLKWVKYLLLGSIVCFAAYALYFIFIRSEIPKTQPNVNQSPLGRLDSTFISFSNRWGDYMEVQEYDLVLPELRNDDLSNHISIHFIKIPTTSPTPGSPIFFLAGGPGTPGNSLLSRSYFYVFKKLSALSDVIIIDQRGTGHSIPNLRCRNTMDMPTEESENWQEDILNDIVKKCAACADEFRSMNINLNGYNSLESAHDIDAIRQALGYDLISLFGYSYGTTLAQHYVSLYEQHTDKLIFAGPTAPDLSPKLPEQLESQYMVMDSIIRADPKMSKYIPDFIDLMKDQHKILESQSIKMELPLMDAVGDDDGVIFTSIFRVIAFFKPSWNITLSDTHMRMMMAQNSGRSGWTRIAPRYYHLLANGEYSRLGNYLRNFRRQTMPNALFFTVAASTHYDSERWNSSMMPRPDPIINHFDISFGRYKEVLDAFEVDKIEGLNQPISSEKSILLIGGTLDGRTPMSNIDSLSLRFPNAEKVIIHNGSHDDLVDSEVLDIMMSYLKGDSLGVVELYRSFEFLPPVDFELTIVDTLEVFRLKYGIEKAIEKFKELKEIYSISNEYIYDISEASLNNYGYQLMNDKLFVEAEKVLQSNAELHPQSSNVYNSLAEAQISLEKYEDAVVNLQQAVRLNYLDGYSHGLLKRYKEGSVK
ncbi:MAG: alpha/beta fold hydrolase [Saprospiraceae bacterium]|nr:alpha/beta fold hydrolase [Saprospiraceae bacterium]